MARGCPGVLQTWTQGGLDWGKVGRVGTSTVGSSEHNLLREAWAWSSEGHSHPGKEGAGRETRKEPLIERTKEGMPGGYGRQFRLRWKAQWPRAREERARAEAPNLRLFPGDQWPSHYLHLYVVDSRELTD